MYVLIEKGETVRPVDGDEAAQWVWDRVCTLWQRAQHPCRMNEYLAECRAPDSQCCQGGGLVARKGWRRKVVRRG